MDLDDLKLDMADEGVAINLVGPNGVELFGDDGEPLTITVLSGDSDKAKAIDDKFRKAALKRAQRSRRNQITTDEIDEQAMQRLVELTVGWTNIEKGGKPLDFNRKNVRLVYEEYKFIADQVAEAIEDRGLFMTDKSTSSASTSDSSGKTKKS